MMACGIVGTVGKFMSATHMGMTSKPSRGGSGVNPGSVPSPSTAIESMPCLFMMDVKSYVIVRQSFLGPWWPVPI